MTDRRPPRERERAGARSLGSRLAGVRARLRRGHRVPSCNLWERPCVMRGDEIDVRVSDVSIRTRGLGCAPRGGRQRESGGAHAGE